MGQNQPEQIQALLEKIKGDVENGLQAKTEDIASLKDSLKEVQDNVKKMQAAYSVSVPGVEDEKEKFSFAKCFQHFKNGNTTLAKMDGFEGDVIRQTMKAQTVDPASAGGVFVPTEVSDRVVEKAINMMVLSKLPIQRISMYGSNKLTVPTVTGNPSAAWFAELAEITESSMTFGSVTLEPWKAAALMVSSNELLKQVDALNENWFLNQMARQVALAFDTAGLKGTGSGDDQPEGILNTTGIKAITPGANGDAADWFSLSELEELLEDENTFVGDLAFISNPKVFRRLREQTVAQYSGQAARDAQPLIKPFLSQAQLEAEVGMPMLSTNALTTSVTGTNNTAPLILGDFSQFMMAMYGSMELALDTSAEFKKYGTVMRAVMRADLKVLRPESFAVNPAIAVSAV